ncbi:MAG: hypothetical protein AAF927_07790 [Bacteroidota bacterium]
MKSFFFGGFLTLLTLFAGLNVTLASDSTHIIYRIYLGVVSDQADLDQFDPLKPLGFISSYANVSRGRDRLAPGLRVYLGEYLDKTTAAHMLLQVWGAGFDKAYIERDNLTLRYGVGSELIYTIQLGAFRRLPMQKFAALRDELPYGIYVRYEDGLFKVFAGLYASFELGEVKRKTIPWLRQQGYNTAYVKQFREAYIWED